MQKTKRKRRSNDIGCLNEKKSASKTVLTQRPIHPDITTFEDGFGNLLKSSSSSSELTKQIESELSESVVSLASFVGSTVLFECTGIFIENLCTDATSILTSANIVGSSDSEITDNLTIKVRLPSNRVVIGLLHHCDFKYNLAVVNIRRARGFQEAHLSRSHGMQFEPNSKLVAVGCCFDSGMLKCTNGTVIGNASDGVYELMLSTYKMNMAWIGCPLIDFDGNFVGMNLQSGQKTMFTPVNKILECLGYLTTVRVESSQVVAGIKEAITTKAQNAGMLKDGMHEINSFEEEFVDNIWSTLSEDVANTMAGCVVSLASFNGKAKCFACTGLIIDCNPVRILTSASLVKISGDENKIDDNLQIEAYLNNTEQVTGTLRHYDLCYNVAVVEIMGSCGSTAVGLRRHISFTPNMEVLAVGRLIEHRKLMASRGVLIDRKGKLACEELRISTCKITKAGIGGPLIDARGNFVGMNFFHDEETPYLPREKNSRSRETFQMKEHANDGWPEPRHRYFIPTWYPVPFGLFPDDDVYVDSLDDLYSKYAWHM
ncbi:unnamed protein product [Triticum turgidum subsp. durum]|uniref:Uncharacterized protein n=1 Tax=Triticum turgidum subsp. durum TaxID=4567 RepID=A0A9R0U3Y3_TRITD|nr:unnamed protein product [Triticum turgidum subsp. durum]